MLALDDVEPTNAGPDVNAYARGVLRRHLQGRHLHRFIRRGQREVDEAPHLLKFLLLDEVEGVEVLNLSRNLTGERGGIEMRDPGDTALPG